MFTSYFTRPALNEVVHGRCVENCRFIMVFAEKHRDLSEPGPRGFFSKGGPNLRVYFYNVAAA